MRGGARHVKGDATGFVYVVIASGSEANSGQRRAAYGLLDRCVAIGVEKQAFFDAYGVLAMT
jgi:hypothetical protein